MNKIDSSVMILDGAMGTQLQRYGMPNDVCPEVWAVEHPEVLERIYLEYIAVGSEALQSCTFGANRLKLAKYGHADRCEELNKSLVKIAKKFSYQAKIGGNIGPLGHLLEPMGEISFEKAVSIFREQTEYLVQAGVDYISIETMMDIQEARAALIAAKEACDLPIHVTMTFENGRTLMGTDPATALITLQALGADAIGCNCGNGPEEMVPLISDMSEYALVPLIAKPNAGMPALVDGKTVFPMGAQSFANACVDLATCGARQIGGCCGTTSEHILALRNALDCVRFISKKPSDSIMLSSNRSHVAFSDSMMMGHIQLNAQPLLLEAVKNEDFDQLMDAVDLIDDVSMLSLCAENDEIDEAEALASLTAHLCAYSPLPMALRPTNAAVLEKALRIYPGRALVILDCAPASMHDAIAEIAEFYGAVCVF